MPTLAETQTHVDDWFATIWATIQAKQEAFKTANGRYFRGLSTHSSEGTMPQHRQDTGFVDRVPNNLAANATGFAWDWNDFYPELSVNVMAAALKMHTYDGPAGHGYYVFLWFDWAGSSDQFQVRFVDGGLEPWRTTGWLVPPWSN